MGPEGRLVRELPVMAAGPAASVGRGRGSSPEAVVRGPLCTHDSGGREADRDIPLEAGRAASLCSSKLGRSLAHFDFTCRLPDQPQFLRF